VKLLSNSFRRVFNKAKPSVIPELIIIGLGNPGSKYNQTRHNLGFMCVNHLSNVYSISLTDRRRYTILGDGKIENIPVILAKPRTFVNGSGDAALYLTTRYQVTPKNLLVIYDDLNLPLGKIRLRTKGSSGGHNGLKSISNALGSNEFPRVRIGIGQPSEVATQVDYVLDTFSPKEQEIIDGQIQLVEHVIKIILTNGISNAMNKFN